MGAADLVPGVSAATIATITGIYPQLVASLARPRWQQWRFWLPLLGGIGTAFLIGVHWIVFALTSPIMRPLLLTVLIALTTVAALQCARQVKRWQVPELSAVGLGLLIAFVLTKVDGIGPLGAGCLAAAALLLPGISGAAVLYALGLYERALVSLAALLSGHPTAEQLTFILTLGSGIVLGVVITVRWLYALLRETPNLLMAFLVGCIVGALPLLWA